MHNDLHLLITNLLTAAAALYQATFKLRHWSRLIDWHAFSCQQSPYSQSTTILRNSIGSGRELIAISSLTAGTELDSRLTFDGASVIL